MLYFLTIIFTQFYFIAEYLINQTMNKKLSQNGVFMQKLCSNIEPQYDLWNSYCSKTKCKDLSNNVQNAPQIHINFIE